MAGEQTKVARVRGRLPHCSPHAFFGSQCQNPHENASVTHPDWPQLLGGIAHLPPHEQERVRAAVPVPPHLCCEDPAWLYRIYQDTTVDVAQVRLRTVAVCGRLDPTLTRPGRRGRRRSRWSLWRRTQLRRRVHSRHPRLRQPVRQHGCPRCTGSRVRIRRRPASPCAGQGRGPGPR